MESKIIGLRRENKNKWERRVALTPKYCKSLIESGIKIVVQPSKLRCYTDKEYLEVGCEINEDISSASVILGVKEIPLEYMLPNKTYFFFSHTFKGQPANMPALRELLNKKIRLIDYELIKDLNPNPKLSQRLVAFGRFAGLAGALDFFQGFGEFVLHKNLSTPFLHVGYSYMYPSVEDAKNALKIVGNEISTQLLPEELCPMIIAVTGTGRVAKGAEEIVQHFPHIYIDPEEIHKLFEKGKSPRRDVVYLTNINAQHMYVNKETNKFNKEEFYQHPQKYKSVFAEKFAEYLSVIIHCIYWDSNSPRILTLDECEEFSRKGKFRILGISDITCDFQGSIEILQKFTTIEDPFFIYDTVGRTFESDFDKIGSNSVLYHAVDHLPAEFPVDSSNHFSEKLSGFLGDVMKASYPQSFEETNDLPLEIKNAMETNNGKLTPKFSYLYKELAKYYDEFKDM